MLVCWPHFSNPLIILSFNQVENSLDSSGEFYDVIGVFLPNNVLELLENIDSSPLPSEDWYL